MQVSKCGTRVKRQLIARGSGFFGNSKSVTLSSWSTNQDKQVVNCILRQEGPRLLDANTTKYVNMLPRRENQLSPLAHLMPYWRSISCLMQLTYFADLQHSLAGAPTFALDPSESNGLAGFVNLWILVLRRTYPSCSQRTWQGLFANHVEAVLPGRNQRSLEIKRSHICLEINNLLQLCNNIIQYHVNN